MKSKSDPYQWAACVWGSQRWPHPEWWTLRCCTWCLWTPDALGSPVRSCIGQTRQWTGPLSLVCMAWWQRWRSEVSYVAATYFQDFLQELNISHHCFLLFLVLTDQYIEHVSGFCSINNLSIYSPDYNQTVWIGLKIHICIWLFVFETSTQS